MEKDPYWAVFEEDHKTLGYSSLKATDKIENRGQIVSWLRSLFVELGGYRSWAHN